jgi:hypothetical protein
MYVRLNPAISRSEKGEVIHEEGGERSMVDVWMDVLRFRGIIVCRRIENRWNR